MYPSDASGLGAPHRHPRDARVLTNYEGTSEIQRTIIADYEFGYRKDKATHKLGLREPALMA